MIGRERNNMEPTGKGKKKKVGMAFTVSIVITADSQADAAKRAEKALTALSKAAQMTRGK